MKKIILFSIIVSGSIFASDSNVTIQENIKQEGLKYIKMLGTALKSELKTQMVADKTGVKALEFCTKKASEITQKVNTQLPNYAKVRRTALKLRNDINNTADTLDIKVMQTYETSLKDKTFSLKDIKVVEDGNTTRIYKALITMPLCLKCHGSNVSTEIRNHIKAVYPNDKAMDFKVGTLRGVIVSEIQKH